MIEYLQYNHYFRCLICNWYEQKNEEGKREDISNLKAKVLDLKEKSPLLYKYIIGLIFADTYRNLSYVRDYLGFDEDDKQLMDLLSCVTDIDDLIKKVENDEISFNLLLENTLNFYMKQDYDKSLCYVSCDNEYLLKFNPFLVLEEDDLFKQIPLEYFASEYKILVEALNGLKEDMNEKDFELTDEEETQEDFEPSDEEETFELIDEEEIQEDFEPSDDQKELEEEMDGLLNLFENMLRIQQYHDPSFCKKCLLELIKTYYRLIKTYSYHNIESLEEADYYLIKLIEENNIDDIIEEVMLDSKLVSILIDEYLNYSIGQCDFEEDEIESCFDEVDSKIKTKLMEN